MKAIVQTRYGPADVLELREIERPTPADDEVLVRVRAASVHPDVWHVMTGLPYVLRLMGSGLLAPRSRVPGTDLAGVVEAVGPGVKRFRPGDEVFGETLRGMQWKNGGAYAEYAVAPESGLVRKPARVSFEVAAAVPTSGLIVLPVLRIDHPVRPGEKVLVNGAGGGLGSLAVQLAKALGAEVTGVDAAGKLEVVRALGADHVIDYAREDFTRGEARYDLIVDVPGNHSLAECRRVLAPGGTWVLIAHDGYGRGMNRWFGQVPRALGLTVLARLVPQLPGRLDMPPKQESLEFLAELLEAGKLTPHVERTYPLAEVPDAIRHLETGRVRGKIVVVV